MEISGSTRKSEVKNNKAVIDNTNYIMDDEKSYLNYKYNLNMKFNDWINKPIELSDIKVGNQLILKYDDTIYNYLDSYLFNNWFFCNYFYNSRFSL